MHLKIEEQTRELEKLRRRVVERDRLKVDHDKWTQEAEKLHAKGAAADQLKTSEVIARLRTCTREPTHTTECHAHLHMHAPLCAHFAEQRETELLSQVEN